jgi:hypothetical protein
MRVIFWKDIRRFSLGKINEKYRKAAGRILKQVKLILTQNNLQSGSLNK